MASLTPTKAVDPIQQQNRPQGNNVSWQSQQNTTQDSWNWTSQGWQFGPIPTFTIFLAKWYTSNRYKLHTFGPDFHYNNRCSKKHFCWQCNTGASRTTMDG